MISEFKTIPKAVYYVQTADGCTVLDPDGDALAEITAPGGYFPGIAAVDGGPGTVTFSAPVKRVVGPFDLAPQLLLTILGQLGGNGGLPAGYKRVEWLESPSTGEQNVPAFFCVPMDSTPGLDSLRIVSEHFVPETTRTTLAQQEGVGLNFSTLTTIGWSSSYNSFFISFDGVIESGNGGTGDINKFFNIPSNEWLTYDVARSLNGFSLKINEEKKIDYPVNRWNGINCSKIGCFGRIGLDNFYSNVGFFGRKKWWKLYKDNVLKNHLVPCLDEVGSPCMYDLVTKTTFYNAGTGEFSYPGKEQEASMFSLRRPITYAQLTEHGVRRLYHVPKGYNGTKEEYAAEHDFKPLVEPEQPEEGYWAPRWTETEDEIVLEWVETEPPMDEFVMPMKEELQPTE